MPAWRPIKRRRLVSLLRGLGFTGPVSGGKHQYMVKGDLVVTIPNPHGGDLSIGLLAIIIRQAGVSRKKWESL